MTPRPRRAARQLRRQRTGRRKRRITERLQQACHSERSEESSGIFAPTKANADPIGFFAPTKTTKQGFQMPPLFLTPLLATLAPPITLPAAEPLTLEQA